MPTNRSTHPRYRALALLAALVFAAACSDDGSSPSQDATLNGFVGATRGDSADGPPPDTAQQGPGHFQGLVRGYTHGVVDTSSTFVLLDDVRVTVYEYEDGPSAPILGDAIAQTFTNANGRFLLPTVPGGNYVVTFVPPSSSGYRSGWTIGWAYPGSGNTDWQIHLPKID